MQRPALLLCLSFVLLARRAGADEAFKIDVFRPPSLAAAIASNGDGFLYIGGIAELSRFDGRTAQNIPRDSAYTAPWMNLILGAPSGALFVSPGHWTADLNDQTAQSDLIVMGKRFGVGLWRLPPDQTSWQNIGAGLSPDVRVFALVYESANVLAGTSAGLLAFDVSTRSQRWVADGLPKGQAITALAHVGPDLWASTSTELWRRTGKTFNSAGPAKDTRYMAARSSGGLWIASSHSLQLRSPRQPPRDLFVNGSPVLPEIQALLETRDGRLWVGTAAGLYVLSSDGTFIKHFGTEQGLPDEQVLSLFEDEAGALWVGTRVGGIARFRARLARNLGQAEGLPNVSNAVFTTMDGAHWFAGTDTVCRRHAELNRCFDLRSFHVGAPTAFAAASSNSVWVATSDGAIFLASEQGIKRFDVVPAATAGSRVLLAKDSRLWIGTEAGQLVRLQSSGSKELRVQHVTTASQGLCEGAVFSGQVLPDGSLILAMDRGIARVDAQGTATCLSGHGLPDKGIRAVVSDGEHIWVGLNNDQGIFVSRGSNFAGVASAQGLYCDSIAALADDARGGLWASCGHGIQWISKHSVLDATSGGFPIVAAVGFSELDDIRNASSILQGSPAGVTTHDGGFLTTVRSGVVGLRAVGAPRERSPRRGPRVVSVVLNGKPQPAAAVLRASIVPTQLQVILQVPSLTSASRVQVVYRTGRSPWINVPVPQAPLLVPDLGQGDHSIFIRASDGAGGWLDDEVTLRVRVARRWQQQPWVLALLGVLVAVASGAVVGLRLLRTRRRFSLIAADRARVARELHDLLGQSFTAVALRVETAKRLMAPGETQAKHALEEAGATIKQAKTNLRHAIWNLRQDGIEQITLAQALQQTISSLRGAGERKPKILFSKTTDKLPHAPMLEYEFLQIAREAVWNALRHADADEIRVELTVAEGIVELVVCDDGKGTQVDLATLAAAGHFGIVGMTERAARIGASLTITPAAPKGTQLRLTVPLEHWRS